MKNKWKLLATLLSGTVLCFQFLSCKKYDPGIFEGTYIGTLSNSSDDTAGNIVRADTFVATKTSKRSIEFTDHWFWLSGNASDNSAVVSQSDISGNFSAPGQANLNGTTLTITGESVIGGNKMNYSFVGIKQ